MTLNPAWRLREVIHTIKVFGTHTQWFSTLIIWQRDGLVTSQYEVSTCQSSPRWCIGHQLYTCHPSTLAYVLILWPTNQSKHSIWRLPPFLFLLSLSYIHTIQPLSSIYSYLIKQKLPPLTYQFTSSFLFLSLCSPRHSCVFNGHHYQYKQHTTA